MRVYMMQRLALAAPTLLLVSVVIFVLVRAMPGDSIDALAGESSYYSETQLDAMRHELHLDRPVAVQYAYWMGDLVSGDFGRSFFSGRTVGEIFIAAFPVTLQLLICTIVLALLLGVPIGVLAATRRNSPFDYLARGTATLGLAIPNFWLGTLVVVLLSFWFSWGPPPGYSPVYRDPWTNVQQFIFPSLVLSTTPVALIARMTRSSMLDVLNQDYIRTAYAKGLRTRLVILRHALRNAFIPVLTILGTYVAVLLSGSVVTELIFSLPGLGRELIEAVRVRDYGVIQGLVLLIACGVILVNLVTDISYAFIDPRVRVSA